MLKTAWNQPFGTNKTSPGCCTHSIGLIFKYGITFFNHHGNVKIVGPIFALGGSKYHFFLPALKKLYAVACYDDGSESLPGHKFDTDLTFGDTSGAEDGDTLRIQMQFKPTDTNGKRLFDDERINGVRLYYTDSEENHSTFWNLGKFDFNLGFIKALTVNTLDDTTGNEDGYPWIAYGNSSLSVTGESGNEIASSDYIEYLEMPKTEAYEDINGHSPFVDTISVEYKAVCIAARRTFVGNLRIWNGSSYEYYNDRI